jgi:hypothetical protein
VVFLAGPSRRKRIASHDVYRTYNLHGEWSIRIEPGGCQIDNYHSRGGTPHLHPPGDYDRPVEIPGLEELRGNEIVLLHLLRHGTVKVDVLLVELTRR